jgi:ABC-2 type transport system ATP-binding protein
MSALVECRDVTLSYDGHRKAVDQLSFQVEAGSLFALVGPNGAGKTSTLRMLSTLTDPGCGTILIDGLDVVRDREGVRRRVGYLPDHYSLYDAMTPVDYLDFFGRLHDLPAARRRSRADELLEEFDLTSKRTSPIRALSRGMRQRLGLAKTLLHDPRVVLLDEPASALDPGARSKLKAVLERLKRRGLALIVSSHILPDLAGLADAIGIMEAGRMVRSGSIEDIQAAAPMPTVYRVVVRAGADRATRALEDLGPRVLAHRAVSAFEFEVEVAGGEDDIAAVVEALVLRGAKVSRVAPRESELEALYRATAAEHVS